MCIKNENEPIKKFSSELEKLTIKIILWVVQTILNKWRFAPTFSSSFRIKSPKQDPNYELI